MTDFCWDWKKSILGKFFMISSKIHSVKQDIRNTPIENETYIFQLKILDICTVWETLLYQNILQSAFVHFENRLFLLNLQRKTKKNTWFLTWKNANSRMIRNNSGSQISIILGWLFRNYLNKNQSRKIPANIQNLQLKYVQFLLGYFLCLV